MIIFDNIFALAAMTATCFSKCNVIKLTVRKMKFPEMLLKYIEKVLSPSKRADKCQNTYESLLHDRNIWKFDLDCTPCLKVS